MQLDYVFAAQKKPEINSPMHSHLSGLKPPYRLPGDTLYFHDWRYLRHGHPQSQWLTQQGENLPIFQPEPVPEMRYEVCPYGRPGLRLRAVPAVKSGPVIAPHNSPFPFFLMPGNLIHDEGMYRFWLEVWPVESFGTQGIGRQNLVCYAESDNGFDWRFPEQGHIEHASACARHAVYGAPAAGGSLHGCGVFKDPSAPLEERYKLIQQGTVSGDALETYLRERPEDVQPSAVSADGREAFAILGAVSSDGFHWQHIPEPLLLQRCDTHNLCEYDVTRGSYVAHVRDHIMSRRSVSRTESADFRRFPRPLPVVYPGASAEHTDLWYSSGKNVMPGADESGAYHVMFPMRWDQATDLYDFSLASSPDNLTWDFLPGGPVCVPGEPGDWDAGGVWAGSGMVHLPDNKMGLLYSGAPVPHKHPRHHPYGGLAWALWERDRLVALEVEDESGFGTWPLLTRCRRIRINHRTKDTGHIRVEVRDANGNALPGRTVDDCDPVRGNEYDRLITWRGESGLAVGTDVPISLYVDLRHAELFAIRFTEE